MKDIFEKSIEAHEQTHGKIGLELKLPLESQEDLSIAYTPGVAGPCQEIHKNPELANTLTIKRNTVAVVSDGSSVLGLGNIGPLAALPVMEGKALLFKKYAGIDAWPICLDTQETDEIVDTIRRIAPVFGGINLEDISSPRCFEIEAKLQDLGIPVFHDDQHGTAAVVLAGLVNACKVLDRDIHSLNVVISGAGAAGIAIAKLLKGIDEGSTPLINDVILCDSKGAISSSRSDINDAKKGLLTFSNKNNKSGTLQEVLEGADVFIGVSVGGLLNADDIARMAKDPIVFALANPNPEILPTEAHEGGAAIVATGRNDFPNQVNNVLIFPGLFRGALDTGAKQITQSMIQAAAFGLASAIKNPTKDKILPEVLDPSVAGIVATAIKEV